MQYYRMPDWLHNQLSKGTKWVFANGPVLSPIRSMTLSAIATTMTITLKMGVWTGGRKP
jgi:hypothetical protein